MASSSRMSSSARVGQGLDFWDKSFTKKTSIHTSDLTRVLIGYFRNESSKVVSVLCQHIVNCSSDGKTTTVSRADWEKFLLRFGPFDVCVANAREFFFTKAQGGEFSLREWYHGMTRDTKSLLIGNPNNFLLREGSDAKWDSMTLEYIKYVTTKGGRKTQTHVKKKLFFRPKKGLFTWHHRDGSLKGARAVDVAIRNMTGGKRKPIPSPVYDLIENESSKDFYQAAGSLS